MADARLSVLTAADGGFIGFLAANLSSLCEHGGHSLPLEIGVLFRGIREPGREKLSKLVRAPHRLCWIEVDKDLCAATGAPVAFTCAQPNYFRLFAPYVCPSEDRAVYLDADTVVVSDLGPLATIPPNGCLIGAVVDWLSRVYDALPNWLELGMDPDAPYFNSAVLYIA